MRLATAQKPNGSSSHLSLKLAHQIRNIPIVLTFQYCYTPGSNCQCKALLECPETYEWGCRAQATYTEASVPARLASLWLFPWYPSITFHYMKSGCNGSRLNRAFQMSCSPETLSKSCSRSTAWSLPIWALKGWCLNHLTGSFWDKEAAALLRAPYGCLDSSPNV